MLRQAADPAKADGGEQGGDEQGCGDAPCGRSGCWSAPRRGTGEAPAARRRRKAVTGASTWTAIATTRRLAEHQDAGPRPPARLDRAAVGDDGEDGACDAQRQGRPCPAQRTRNFRRPPARGRARWRDDRAPVRRLRTPGSRGPAARPRPPSGPPGPAGSARSRKPNRAPVASAAGEVQHRAAADHGEQARADAPQPTSVQGNGLDPPGREPQARAVRAAAAQQDQPAGGRRIGERHAAGDLAIEQVRSDLARARSGRKGDGLGGRQHLLAHVLQRAGIERGGRRGRGVILELRVEEGVVEPGDAGLLRTSVKSVSLGILA